MKVTVDNIIEDLHQDVAKEVMNITSDLSDGDKSRIYVIGPAKTGHISTQTTFQ